MSQLHLGINISETYVEFSIIKGDSIRKNFGSAYQGKTDSDRKEAVRRIIEENAVLKEDFDNVTLAWCHSQSTLVPASIFSESTPHDLFKLCFGSEVSSRTIDHNRIFELSVVNVYTIPDWIKSLFVIKFPRIVLQHAGTHHIREVIGNNAFHAKASLVIHNHYFRMTITKHNNLEFYSSFSYQTAEDIIYHLNFVLQQKELLDEKGTIEICPGTNSDESTIAKVVQGLDKIKHLGKMNIQKRDAFLTKSQLLCV